MNQESKLILVCFDTFNELEMIQIVIVTVSLRAALNLCMSPGYSTPEPLTSALKNNAERQEFMLIHFRKHIKETLCTIIISNFLAFSDDFNNTLMTNDPEKIKVL